MPGEVYDVEVELDACAYAFDAGQRMRLSIAGADWPNTAASPGPVVITVHGGSLELPCWQGDSPHPPPVLKPGSESSESSDGVVWRVERDVLRATTSCVVDHGSTYPVPYDGTAAEHYSGRVSVDTTSFEQRTWAETTFTVRWPGAAVSTTATMEVALTPTTYDVAIDLTAREGTEVVGTRRWQRQIPRAG